MSLKLPGAVPELPVQDIDAASAYYVKVLGFQLDFGGGEGGIAGISNGSCRIFLTSRGFREPYGNVSPVVIWLNLNSAQEVDVLYDLWRDRNAMIVSPPESKPWKLHEFTVADPDGNLLRVFYDFSRDEQAGESTWRQNLK